VFSAVARRLLRARGAARRSPYRSTSSLQPPGGRRSIERELQGYREQHDPIDHAAKELEAMGVKEDELKAADKEIKDIVVEAAKFAEETPEPDASELHTDVLVETY
jgi:pyruvate dehydrogenase E1 component alpha subunit